MKNKNLLTVIVLVMFGLLTSGGCGGSSSDSFTPTNANAIFEKSAWRYSSGTVTANVNGTTETLTIYDFAVYFDSCDIENESGSARFAAIAIMKGQVFTLPLVFDLSGITTTRDGDSWTARTEHGDFTISLTSAAEARMTGTIAYKIGEDIEANIDIVIKKYDPSTGTSINLDMVLNATWMTLGDDGQNSSYGGGYIFSNTDGAIPVDKVFSSWTFSDTSLTEHTTNIAFQLVVSGLEDSVMYYYNVDDETLSASHIFGSVYRLSAADTVREVEAELTGALVFHDENTAYFIISFTADEYSEHVDQHYAIPMYRKTDESGKIDLRDKINTTWEALPNEPHEVYITENDIVAGLESLRVSFTSADIDAKTLTLSANGTFSVGSQDVPVSFENIVLNYDNIGYNTWRGANDNGSYFMISLLSDDVAILTGEAHYQDKLIDAAGVMHQVSE